MDPPPPIECDWYGEVVGDRARFIARLLKEKKLYIGVQNVKLYCSRLGLRLLQDVRTEKKPSCTVINRMATYF